jgi:porin
LTVEGPTAQGWYTFLNTTVADHRTFQDYQIVLGVKHTGTFSWRPQDEVGVQRT